MRPWYLRVSTIALAIAAGYFTVIYCIALADSLLYRLPNLALLVAAMVAGINERQKDQEAKARADGIRQRRTS